MTPVDWVPCRPLLMIKGILRVLWIMKEPGLCPQWCPSSSRKRALTNGEKQNQQVVIKESWRPRIRGKEIRVPRRSSRYRKRKESSLWLILIIIQKKIAILQIYWIMVNTIWILLRVHKTLFLRQQCLHKAMFTHLERTLSPKTKRTCPLLRRPKGTKKWISIKIIAKVPRAPATRKDPKGHFSSFQMSWITKCRLQV